MAFVGEPRDARVHWRNTLRVVVCGRVGDGKSTLIERLGRLGQRPVTANREMLIAETAADARSLQDTVLRILPSHVVVILVDVCTDALAETRRCLALASALRIPHVVVAINKMDRVEFSETVFAETAHRYRECAASLDLAAIACVPLCAVDGDNIAAASPRMPWYAGPTLVECLESIPVDDGDRPPAETEHLRSGTATQFEVTVVWLGDQPMLQGRSYQMTLGTQSAGGTLAPLKYKVDAHTLERIPAQQLELGEIGVCEMQLTRPVIFEPTSASRQREPFILFDTVTGITVGVGLLHFELRRSQNVRWQALDVNKRARAAQKGQKPCVLWFTGLSGAGKSTIANLVENKLHALARHTYLLDGDNVRHGLNKDLGFTEADRVENIRRVAEVARLMVDAGLIVLVSFISPFRAERRMARSLTEPGEFFEVFVDTPLTVAETRDPKGLYKKARRGELKHFTGIDSPYEAPERPEIRIETVHLTPEQAATAILERLAEEGIIDSARREDD